MTTTAVAATAQGNNNSQGNNINRDFSSQNSSRIPLDQIEVPIEEVQEEGGVKEVATNATLISLPMMKTNFFCAYHSCKDDHTWIVDSGASQHMTGSEELLCNIKEGKGQSVTFGNNESVEISGIGTIAPFHSSENPSSTFPNSDAYFIPSMEKSLLSVSKLDKQQMSVLFKNGKCIISDKNDQIVAVAYEDQGLYKLDANNITLDSAYSGSMVTISLSKMQLWHQRLGHLSLDNLKQMMNKNMVYGLPKIYGSKCLCEACIMGTQHRLPFPKGKAWRASYPL